MSGIHSAEIPAADSQEEGYIAYRTLSWSAVGAIALAVISLLALLLPALLLLSVVGLLLSLHAVGTIRRHRDQFTGMPLALSALGLSLTTLLGGIGLHTLIFMTEVMEGYERTSWRQLDSEDPQRDIPSDAALALDGKKIFIKGYIYPDGQRSGITQFVLVPDMGTCCFGGDPALTDMILVTLVDPEDSIEWTLRRRKLHGTLHVSSTLQPLHGGDLPSSGGVYYQLEADHIQ